MAIPAGYGTSIRQSLLDKGISNSDIGMNKATGYVTVGGKDAVKAPKMYNGTSFTTQQGFNDDWSNYQKALQPQPNDVHASGQPVTAQPAQTQPAPNNAYDPKVNDLIDYLLQQAKNPTPVDANAIYNSPQYAAFQAQAQKGADQSIRASQEALGSSGFGRSTALGERAQMAQNDANAYLNTQVVPQLMAQEQSAKQQQLANQFSALDQLMKQQGVYDNRINDANQYALNKGQLTGNFLDPQAATLIDQILQNKQAYGDATTAEGRTSASKSATTLRSQLSAMGVDPSKFGADQTLAKAQSSMSGAGVKTLGAQSMEMQKAQQEWQNAFAQGQFDFQKAQTAWDNNFKDKSFAQSVKDAAAARGLQWANLNQNQQEFIANQAFRDKQFDYQMKQDATQNQFQQDQLRFSKGMDVFKSTGKLPSYMSEYGIDVNGLNNPSIKDDLSAMYSAISQGTAPETLLKTIDDKVKLGLEDSASGDKLKSSLYMLYPDLDPSKPKKNFGESVLQNGSAESLSQPNYWLKKLGF